MFFNGRFEGNKKYVDTKNAIKNAMNTNEYSTNESNEHRQVYITSISQKNGKNKILGSNVDSKASGHIFEETKLMGSLNYSIPLSATNHFIYRPHDANFKTSFSWGPIFNPTNIPLYADNDRFKSSYPSNQSSATPPSHHKGWSSNHTSNRKTQLNHTFFGHGKPIQSLADHSQSASANGTYLIVDQFNNNLMSNNVRAHKEGYIKRKNSLFYEHDPNAKKLEGININNNQTSHLEKNDKIASTYYIKNFFINETNTKVINKNTKGNSNDIQAKSGKTVTRLNEDEEKADFGRNKYFYPGEKPPNHNSTNNIFKSTNKKNQNNSTSMLNKDPVWPLSGKNFNNSNIGNNFIASTTPIIVNKEGVTILHAFLFLLIFCIFVALIFNILLFLVVLYRCCFKKGYKNKKKKNYLKNKKNDNDNNDDGDANLNELEDRGDSTYKDSNTYDSNQRQKRNKNANNEIKSCSNITSITSLCASVTSSKKKFQKNNLTHKTRDTELSAGDNGNHNSNLTKNNPIRKITAASTKKFFRPQFNYYEFKNKIKKKPNCEGKCGFMKTVDNMTVSMIFSTYFPFKNEKRISVIIYFVFPLLMEKILITLAFHSEKLFVAIVPANNSSLVFIISSDSPQNFLLNLESYFVKVLSFLTVIHYNLISFSSKTYPSTHTEPLNSTNGKHPHYNPPIINTSNQFQALKSTKQ